MKMVGGFPFIPPFRHGLGVAATIAGGGASGEEGQQGGRGGLG